MIRAKRTAFWFGMLLVSVFVIAVTAVPGAATAVSNYLHGGSPATAVKATGRSDWGLVDKMVAARGWSSQSGCVHSLWGQESGANPDIMNPDSEAFGIAQALDKDPAHTHGVFHQVVDEPGGQHGYNVTIDQYPSTAANAGQPGPQIDWGLRYIKGRYGDPCTAEAHETLYNWY